MELSESPLANELALINQEADFGRYYSYTAVFTTEAEDIDVMKVISMDWIRDYVDAFADEVHMQIAMPSGTYLKRVLPYKENLKITVTKTPVGRTTDNDPRRITVQEFQCFILGANETDTIGTRPETATEEAANLTGFQKVDLQLQELVFEQLRTEMVGGVPQAQTPYDFLLSMLWKSLNELEADLANQILGVNSTVPPSNNTKREHILIPHGTPLTSLAKLLQTQLGGIYSAGLGCYLQRSYWYVWPVYDYTRFDSAERTASFIVLPDPKFKGTEKTYRIQDKHLIAIITGGVSKQDGSEAALLNQGNAVRFADSDKLMEGFFEKDGNKGIAKRTNNNNEYVGIKRRTDTSMSRVTTNLGRSNVYHEASKLAARAGAYITLNWENSDPDMITPDLQCEVGFTVDGAPVFIQGIVVHAHAFSALAGTGLHQEAHQITTQIVVMVDRNSPEYQQFIETKDAQAAQEST